jgi:hypothetical protein
MKKKPMKLVKRVGVCVGAAAVSTTMLTGCNWFHPAQEEVECVYGPPPEWEEDYNPEEDMIETVYGPEWMLDGYDHDPAEDLPAPVYGPPPEDNYDPAEEEPVDVYGPPGDYNGND